MSTTWHFYPQKPTDPIHNPISGEFFSTEAVGNVAEALVREAIQNTLDARKKKADGSRQPASVRVFLSDLAGALAVNRGRRWFGSLWPHVTAPGNGLRNQPSAEDRCPFVVFEDFGTIGLTGNPAEHQVVEGLANHFLNFFRAEGHSDKGEQDRGSWGVGKTVFPRASRISSYIGLTVRSDDNKQLLLGRSILKYHRVGGQPYKSDGYLGVRRADGFMLPSDDPATLAEFRSDFKIKRQSESGLSIVVPWYEINGDDGMTRDKVLAAVLRGFFYPILMGHLSVTIAALGEEIALDAGSILRKVEALGGSLRLELLPIIKLAEWAQTRTTAEFRSLVPPPANRAQNWSEDLVPPDLVKHIRQSLAQRQPLALRIPMSVALRNGSPQGTYFDIFMEHSEEDSEKPVFIRDELIISDVKSPRISQVRSLVIVQDSPLATLLRDAETPAHTQWNQSTSKFKDKYKFGPGAINFVRQSVSQLLRIINQAEQQPDPTITIDFFSVPATPEYDDAVPARLRRPREMPGGGPTSPTPPPPPGPPRPFRIDKLIGGFAIRSGDDGAAPPPFIDVRVAYDVRRGNPLRKYHPSDFDLGHLPIRCDTDLRGVLIRSASGNQVLVAIQQAAFNFEVTGFDPARDLYVRAEVKEATDVD
jgi:hypothetical protein